MTQRQKGSSVQTKFDIFRKRYFKWVKLFNFEQLWTSDILKEAYVTPIYKKGKRHNPENDRPISVTSTLAKIVVRLLLEQMWEHLDMDKIKLLTKISLVYKNKSCVLIQKLLWQRK